MLAQHHRRRGEPRRFEYHAARASEAGQAWIGFWSEGELAGEALNAGRYAVAHQHYRAMLAFARQTGWDPSPVVVGEELLIARHARGLVEREVAAEAGSYRFSHMLCRETLHRALRTTER